MNKFKSLIYEEREALKVFVLLFYIIFFLYDVIHLFVYPVMNINEARIGWPEGGMGIGVYILVIALFPISIYFQKQGYVYFVKYLFLIGYMLIDLINNLMIYLNSDRVFESGNMVEILLILFSPIFVNRKYFYLVSLSVIGKYVFFSLLLQDIKVVIPLVLCVFFFIISHSLLKRFQSYVRTVVEMMSNMKETENLAVIGTMSTTIAHEIRNPLTALKGFTQMQKERNPANTMSYDIMLQEIERINGFVSELMLLGKPKSTNYERCNIQGILLYVVQLMESYAAQYRVRFHLQVDGNLPVINGDDKQLKQVLLNIIKNGVESMLEGGDIHIRAYEKTEGHLCISIEDQGFGIEKEQLEKIGKAFYTTKENGTGLGLMITYKIIEEHQGSIMIQSSMGIGTKVEIFLPTV
ncbi:two-component sensor histidine kinase [Bacillus thuringiensis serovar roskildiensis]|uniref:histidine kinase n=1 Tax=Bacillus thuringiensis serovar sooncheon TaxID=180891 RepID=A0A9Q5SL07_BACTU|nr:ATP-binding protein [Bacillus thuringiensis]OTW70222.1 two-component sensor histidine kinase [Bacillus thuringiensis serovar coreanensis]OTX47946.1 two-component sensor histidine kinase [Bacillus thuringiensis serovar sooncheon]OTX54936.1 two-component sensor histidine kinase [Bacillus thuringiensis serovar guiyangiensis]OTX68991.1 two-component sensor histidine kinase [Bacillus thuringiensis serovar roskildiensis]